MNNKTMVACALLCCMLFLIGCTASADEGGKIPITTKSKRARELFLSGRDLAERLKAVEAREHFQKALAEDPNFAIAHLNLALTSTSAKEFFAALGQATALADKVSKAERLWIKGQEAGANGDPVKQRELYQELAKQYPMDERAQNLLGGHYFGQQDWNKAIGQYEKAIKINPGFSQPYNQLGYAYRFLNRYEDAERTFKKYIELIPKDPNPYDSYAELLLKMGKYEESIKNYMKALQQDATFVASHVGIATGYNSIGDYSAARKQLEEMSAVAANDGQRRAAHFARAVSYVYEGDLDMALNEQEKILALAEKIDDAAAAAGDYARMGNILAEFGQPKKALTHYNKSIEAIRKSGQSKEQKELAERFHLFNLAGVALGENDLATAKKHTAEFAKQATAAQNKFQIMFSHQLAGRVAAAEQNHTRALEELQQANQQNPMNLFRIAMAYEGSGDRKKAEEWYKKASNFNALNSLNQGHVHRQSQKMVSAK